MTEDQRRSSGPPPPPINPNNTDPKRWGGPTHGNPDRQGYDHPDPSSQPMMHQQYHTSNQPHPHGPPHLSPGPDAGYKKQQTRSPPQQHPSMYQGNKQQMRSPPHHPGMYAPHPSHPQPQYHPQQHTGYQHAMPPHQHPHHPNAPHHGYGMGPPQMYHQWQHHPYPPQMPHGHQHHGSYHPSQQHPYGMPQQPASSRNKKPTTLVDEKKESPEVKKSPSPSPTKDESPKKELSPLKVAPMRPDFHFFVQDHREGITSEAKLDIMEHLTLTDSNDIDPFLLYSNLNEKLISMWETTPQSTRTAYLVKEEEDRKRFMNAEEVASQHCATLTARAKSPAFVKRGDAPVKIDDEEGEDLTEDMEVEPDKMVETKLKPKSRSASQVTADEHEMSPPKKNKVDDQVDHLTMKEMYGDYEFMPHHADLSSESLMDLADKIPKQAHDKSQNKIKDVEILEKERTKFIEAAEEAREKETRHSQAKTTQPHEIPCTSSRESQDSKGTNAEEELSHNSNKENESSSDDDNEDMEESCLEVEKLLAKRTRQVRGKKVKEYLVRWKGFGPESDSWEPLKNVSHCEEQVKAIDKRKKAEDKEKKEKLRKISDN